MAYRLLLAAVVGAMLLRVLVDWMTMAAFARLLKQPHEAFVTVPATITGVGGPFGSMQYRFRFADEQGRPQNGRFYITTRQLPNLPLPKAISRGVAVTVTYARSDPRCVYIEPCRAYYRSYLTRGRWFMAAVTALLGAAMVAQVIRIVLG
jgi:hypothetical protein